MPSSLKIATRIREGFSPKRFDMIVKISKSIAKCKPPEKKIESFKFVHLNDSIKYTIDFLGELNPEYQYRVLNIMRDNLRDNYRPGQKVKRHKHLSLNNGVDLLFTDYGDRKKEGLTTYGEVGESYMSESTGELRIDDTRDINVSHGLVHELAHKLSIHIPINKQGERAFDEVPSIVCDLLYLDYLESIGYDQDEIDFLRYERYDCTIYPCMLFLLLDEIIAINRHDIHIREVIDSLMEKYPALDRTSVENTWKWLKDFYEEEKDFRNVIDKLKGDSRYIIGFGMSSYYKKDYYQKKEESKLFKLMHYLGDELMTIDERRERYEELDLPFYREDISSILEAFEEEHLPKEKTNKL